MDSVGECLSPLPKLKTGFSTFRTPVAAESAAKSFKDIKNYELQSLVGTGAFAKVYRALHKPSETVYALKVMDKQQISKVSAQLYLITK